jgi:hypothetical protein
VRRVMVALLAMSALSIPPPPAHASGGGLAASVNGCGYARVNLAHAVTEHPAVTATKVTSYVTWVLYQSTAAWSDVFTSGAVVPALSAKALVMPGRASALPAGRYTLVACADSPVSLRISLPTLGRWYAPRLTAIGPREATVSEIGTAALETGIARGGPLSGSRTTFAMLIASRFGAPGATSYQMCFIPKGGYCSTQTSGEVDRFDRVSPDDQRVVYGVWGMHPAGPPVEGVVQVVSSRAYTGSDRDRMFVAGLPAV